MTRWAPAKRDTMRALAREVTQQYPAGRVIVAVTGGPGDVPLALAADLAAALRDDGRAAFLALSSAFERDAADLASREATSAAARHAHRLDETALRRALVDPFRLAGSTGFQTAVWDPVRRVPLVSEWTTTGPDAYLLIAGPGLLRPSLRGAWNTSVWIDAPWAGAPDPAAEAEWAAQLGDGDPRAAAGALVDGRDPEHPRRVFADAC